MFHSWYAGKFLTVGELVNILPADYYLYLKDKDRVIWEGISWVLPFEKIFNTWKDCGVREFTTTFYNDRATIQVQAVT